MDDTTADRSRWIGLFCAAMIAALYVVAVVSGTELRHVLQTAPLWVCVILGLKRVHAVRWLALPMLVFWLGIMTLIWLYLLGWARVVSGHFSPVEIAMTIVIGVAAGNGIKMCFDRPRAESKIAAILLLSLGAAMQLAAFRISLLPSIAKR